MSESPEIPWYPPDQNSEEPELVESDSEVESDDDLDGVESSPDRYTPNDLGEYTVSTGPRRSDLTVRIGAPALRKLYVQPGDTLTIYEHPRGLLVVPSYESSEADAIEEADSDEFDLDWAWDEESEEPTPEMWATEESGPIPPEVPWSEMGLTEPWAAELHLEFERRHPDRQLATCFENPERELPD